MAPPGCGIRCTSSCQEAICGMEAFLEKHTDPEADIIECNTNTNNNPAAARSAAEAAGGDTDVTQCSSSSSFGDTVSDTPNVSGISDVEVESSFIDPLGISSAFDAIDRVLEPRKKKLTKHWRKFIRPLMWRCKWTELRIMEVELKGLSYTRELASYDAGKLPGLDQSTQDFLGSQSYRYHSTYPRKKLMKRRKRRKVEGKTDVASYMSQHNLFTFIENKRYDQEDYSTADDAFNPVLMNQSGYGGNEIVNHDEQPREVEDWNDVVERILKNLETVQSRVHRLKSQLENVISEHAGKFSSSENLSLFAPFDEQSSSNRSPAFSVGNGDALSAGVIYPPTEHFGDLGFPDIMISSFEEAMDIPDIFEVTITELPSANSPHLQLQTVDSSQDMVNDVTLGIPIVEAEQPSSIHDIPIEITSLKVERTSSIHDVPIEIPSVEAERHSSMFDEPQELKDSTVKFEVHYPPQHPLIKDSANMLYRGPSTLESSLGSEFAPKNKRKRGERKFGRCSWSKRCSIDTQ